MREIAAEMGLARAFVWADSSVYDNFGWLYPYLIVSRPFRYQEAHAASSAGMANR
jgi:hypothetical protein